MAARSANVSMSGLAPATGTLTTRSGRAARSAAKPRSPTSSSTSAAAPGSTRTGFGAWSSAWTATTARACRRRSRREHRGDHIGAHAGLVAQQDEDAVGRRAGRRRREAEPQGRSETSLRVRVHDDEHVGEVGRIGRQDGVADGRGVASENEHQPAQPGAAGRLQDVGDERPTVEPGAHLAPTEPAPRPRREDQPDHPRRVAHGIAGVRSGAPLRPYRSATISAMIARAVSAGVRPPRSSPIGPRSRARSASPTPGREEPGPAIGLRLPRPDRADVAAAATERLDDRGLVELHVVGQDRDRVGRPQADLVGDLVRPADHERVDVGEPLPRGECRPPVDDDRRVAQLPGDPRQRHGDLHGADDDEAERGREALHEELAPGRLDGCRSAAGEQVPCCPHDLGVDLRRARSSPAAVPSSATVRTPGRGLAGSRSGAARTSRAARPPGAG